MAEPVVVFRTLSQIEAAVVRGLLDAHGIPAFIVSGGPRSVFPVSVSRLGELRVTVPGDHADEARAVIEDYRQDHDARRVVPMFDRLAALESAIGHRFADRGLLEHALTHSSHAREDVTGGVADNESLEFLGDAVLGFIVADVLFREFPEFDEGRKSKIKSALVSKISLARIGERLGLGDHLLLGRGEEKTGGRGKHAVVADACEAVIAAIYLDGGIEPAREFVRRELGPLVDQARRTGLVTSITGDFKSALQEWLQGRDAPPPEYRVVAESGPAHHRHFEIEVWIGDRAVARAGGRSKKEAAQAAAQAALAALGAPTE
jgi:ribonuclease-3